MRRGILGGTFDPPHIAHLTAAEAAYRQLGLDVVTFLPAGAPWQKAGRQVSAATHRWAMTELAVAGVSYFEADDREVHRRGWTYTIDTLGTFAVKDDLVLLLGADAAEKLPTWHRFGEVLDRAALAVAPRPGTTRSSVEAAVDGHRVSWLEAPEIPLSGTLMRAMAAEGRSIRFLVPDAVWEYVSAQGLYAGT